MKTFRLPKSTKKHSRPFNISPEGSIIDHKIEKLARYDRIRYRNENFARYFFYHPSVFCFKLRQLFHKMNFKLLRKSCTFREKVHNDLYKNCCP